MTDPDGRGNGRPGPVQATAREEPIVKVQTKKEGVEGSEVVTPMRLSNVSNVSCVCLSIYSYMQAGRQASNHTSTRSLRQSN